MKIKNLDQILKATKFRLQKYTENKEPIILDSNVNNLLVYNKYILNVINNIEYINNVKTIQQYIQSYKPVNYIYNFPYKIEKFEDFSIIPMDKLPILTNEEKLMLNRILPYLQHEDIYKNKWEVYKNLNLNPMFMDLSDQNSFTTQQTLFKSVLDSTSANFYDNILEIFKEYKKLFGYVKPNTNNSDYANYNGKIILVNIF